MTTKLYVGNLPYRMSEEELKDLFGEKGTVLSVRIITDSRTGRSKGFGFVEMENDDQAQKAIDELDGSEVQGRTVKVAPARPPRERNRFRR